MLYNIRTSLQELPPFNLVGTHRHGRGDDFGPIDFPNAFHAARRRGGAAEHPLDGIRAGPDDLLPVEHDGPATVGANWAVTRGLHRNARVQPVAAGAAEHPPLGRAGRSSRQRGQRSSSRPGLRSSIRTSAKCGSSTATPTSGTTAARSAFSGALANGLQLGSTFTYSKTEDEGSGVTSGGDELPQSQRGIYAWDMHLKRGPSVVRHPQGVLGQLCLRAAVRQEPDGLCRRAHQRLAGQLA